MFLKDLERSFHQNFRFRARDQDRAVDGKRQAHKLGLAQNVLKRFMLETPLKQRSKGSALFGSQGPVKLQIQVQPLQSKHVRKHQLDVQPGLIETAPGKITGSPLQE